MTDKHRQKQHGTGPRDIKQPAGAPAKGAPDQKLAEISAEVADELIRERDEYLDALQRLQAEFANYRRRVVQESEQMTHRASAQVVEDLLPVLDNFDRAMKAAIEHDEKVLGGGMELVYNQLRDILTRRGLCEINAHGQPFDPNQHEAVLCRPSGEHEEGTVVEVLEKGYQVGEKVVRPAKVVVSKNEEDG